ncbi:MAG: sulfite exporter TauE/SafE family protein [Planctomycetaceae bacterium]|nr:sulfite exporter TauE/SafE family protein [Planctomycetaceae bacterium]
MHSTFSLEFAFLLGALHALEPGHGKTAMYVYMMQGRRSLWHPVLLGASSALSHSLSLAGIAFAVHLASHAVTGDHYHEGAVANTMQWVSASLVLAVGLYLLVQAARGRQSKCCSQHADSGHVHDHDTADTHDSCCHGDSHGHACTSHDHGHAEESASQLVQLQASTADADSVQAPERAKSDFRITALLGLGVGLLPCPSALAAYFAGFSSGDMTSAWLTIGLFAGGIAASISAVGILLQYFGTKLGGRMDKLASPRVWAWGRALVILTVGAIYLGRLLIADTPEHIHVH